MAQVSADQVPSAFLTELAKVHKAQVSADQVPPAFPPEPPPVLGHAGAVFIPNIADLGGSVFSGSFSRVSAIYMSGFQLPLKLAMLEPEFPEDWEMLMLSQVSLRMLMLRVSLKIASAAMGEARLILHGDLKSKKDLSRPVEIILICPVRRVRKLAACAATRNVPDSPCSNRMLMMPWVPLWEAW